jgi:UrcA family protein
MKHGLATNPLLPAALGALLLVTAGVSVAAEEVPELGGVTVTSERQLSVERPTGVVDQEVRVKTLVRYSDLDVNTDKGRHDLEARITGAASEICTELDKILPFRTMEHGNCVRQAVDRAMAEVDAKK